MPKLQGVIKTEQPWVKSFNGQRVKLSSQPASTGISGETELYNLAVGALYLRQDEIAEDSQA